MPKKKTTSGTLTLKTDILKEMVARAIKGAGNNKIHPLTQMMDIRLKDNELNIITTDATNYLYIRRDKVEGDDFEVVVGVEQFSKLISRWTDETITFEKGDVTLGIKGKGDYKIPIQFENNEMVNYTDPMADFEAEGDPTTIKLTTIEKILATIKPAIAVSTENPCYMGYYAGDRVIGTNRYLIHAFDAKLFDEPKLISPEVMNLLSVMSTEDIDVDFNGDIMVFTTPDCIVYGHELEGIEEFDSESISAYIDAEMGSSCTVGKNVLLQVLDRLSLFVTDFDESAINLVFTEDGIQISSLNSTGVETIPFIDSENFNAFEGRIDIDEFMKQIKSIAGDVVHIEYNGDDIDALKLVNDKVVQVIALIEY